MIYLDHNATTAIDERVLEVMMPFMTGLYANPSSLYRAARIARSAIDTARQQVADLFKVSAAQVIFTSGGTEANNLAIKGCFEQTKFYKIAVGVFEHPSVLQPAESLKAHGVALQSIAVNPDGCFVFDQLQDMLITGLDFISLMAVNNETGVIQNISEIAEVAHQYNAIFHTDAVQAAGKTEIDFESSGVNLMSISSHKIYGPKGCGALIVDQKERLSPLLWGGGQEQALRGGTENVAAIVGFGKAAELALSEGHERRSQVQALSTLLQDELETIAGLTVFGKASPRIGNTVQFGVPETDGEMLLMQLDKKGFAVSSGSACASGAGEASHVLTAMGVSEALAKSAIRVSFGHCNQQIEVSRFVEALKTLIPATI